MTIEELQAQEDAILKQMAQPEQLTSGTKGVKNRSASDLQKALEMTRSKLKELQGQTTGAIGNFYTTEGL